MLNAQSDRIDYREMLSPPPSYQVSFAVGSTYSLDLETLTAVCAIIGLNVEGDTELMQSPLHMLEAIRKASGRLLIFCQAGQINLPDKPNKLLPLLENCVSEISLRGNRSFHAKTWFLKYTAEGMPDKYRLIVTSRNLTFDRSWDVALCIDSARRGEPFLEKEEYTGEAMRSFLLWLHKNANSHNSQLKQKRSLLSKLAGEIIDVKWRYISKEFESFDFIPFGVGVSSNYNLFDSFHKILVISPFLSKSVIEDFEKKRLVNPDCTLITRKTELSKLNTQLLTSFNTYTIKDNVVDGEERISDNSVFKPQDIHAKIYLRTKWSNSELYVGSANASYNAFFGGNVECMIALKGKQRYLNVDKLKQDLFGSDENANPFEKVDPKEYVAQSDDSVLTMLECAVRDFCALQKSAVVTGVEKFNVAVTLPLFQSDAKMTLSPLMKTTYQTISESILFTGLELREVSEWYVVSAKSRYKEISRVLKIQTTGIPDTRDAAVFSEVVRDKSAFLTYVGFLLSEDYLESFLESTRRIKGDFRFLTTNYDTPVLYERMLKAAASNKGSLLEIRELISLANGNIIPQDFLRLYEQFENVVKQ